MPMLGNAHDRDLIVEAAPRRAQLALRLTRTVTTSSVSENRAMNHKHRRRLRVNSPLLRLRNRSNKLLAPRHIL
jgi:hypothetical protein